MNINKLKVEKMENENVHSKSTMLVKRILFGNLVILFIGVCLFTLLFCALWLVWTKH